MRQDVCHFYQVVVVTGAILTSILRLPIHHSLWRKQWHSRTPSMLEHSMGMLRLFKLLCKVQKRLGGWGMLSQNFTDSQIGSEAIP